MSGHDDCDSLLVDFFEDIKNFQGVGFVQVASWFICDQEGGSVSQGSGNGDSLLFST